MNGALNFTGQYSDRWRDDRPRLCRLCTGQLNAYSQGRPFYDDDQSDYYGLYVQDAWRVSSHFTVNMGLRFEPYLPQRNTDDYVETFSMRIS